MTFSEVASASVRRRTFWAGNWPLSEPSSVAISRTSLATAGSFRNGRWVVADADDQGTLPTRLASGPGWFGGGGVSGKVDRDREPGVPWRVTEALMPLSVRARSTYFVVVERQEPVPHVPKRNLGCLGDPAVLDEGSGIALGVG